ncbi:MAG: hypothetical protein NC206_09060 [Bacteroides sp.]|nr:hypothetical protein [Roseburia sp.]MCM1347219.1 hypothetical protein [Bacteroides sp.]MCM1421691.1 hypothetical protein [Bacteroides sp.]
MKTLKYFSILLMTLLFSVNLTSCSDDDDDEPSNPLIGTWVERYQPSASTGYVVTTFKFEKDGTGVQTTRIESSSSGFTLDPVSFLYSYKDGDISIKFEDDVMLYSGTAKITGSVMILKYGNTYYTLTKQ